MKFFHTDYTLFHNNYEIPLHFDNLFPLDKINQKFLILNNDTQVSTLVKIEAGALEDLADMIPFLVKKVSLVLDHSFNLTFFQKNYYGKKTYLLAFSLSKSALTRMENFTRKENENFEDVKKLVKVLAEIVETFIPKLEKLKLKPKWLKGETEILPEIISFWTGEEELLKEKGEENIKQYFSNYILGNQKFDFLYRAKNFQTFYNILNEHLRSTPELVKSLINFQDSEENFLVVNSYTKEKSGYIVNENEKNAVKKMKNKGINKATELSFTSMLTFFYPNQRIPEFGTFFEGKAFNKLEHDSIYKLMQATGLSWELISVVWEPLLYQSMPGNYSSSFRNDENLLTMFVEEINEEENT